jgi:phosphoglycolate phosphatase-like HAD superfamily hydrolase
MFDVDGTLTNSNDVDSQCYVQAMSEFLGITINSEWSHYRHVTDSGIASELFDQQQRGQQDIAFVQRRFISLLRQSLINEPSCCRQIVGAGAFLKHLRKTTGIAIGLATGSWAESARIKLLHAGLHIDGLAFASADDAESRTEIMMRCLQRAAKSADIDQFNAITYIGDGAWDVQAAISLGWQFIGIGSGFDAERLRNSGASHIFEDFNNYHAIMQVIKATSSNMKA